MTMGKAYAAIKFPSPKDGDFGTIDKAVDAVDYELPIARDVVGVPKTTEYSVTIMQGNYSNDNKLKEFIEEKVPGDLEILIEATNPGEDNEKTAGGLADVLNQTYNYLGSFSGKSFSGKIFYEDEEDGAFRFY